MAGLLRVGVPDYSERALREALVNALIHRDYLRLRAVHFQWLDDHIEISNPGGFPEGVRLDNLLVTAPRPRNPLLADAFKRAGIVERTARGIDTIFYEQLRNGRPAPSYARSFASGVTVPIPGGEANPDFVRLLVTEAQNGRVLGLDEMLILNSPVAGAQPRHRGRGAPDAKTRSGDPCHAAPAGRGRTDRGTRPPEGPHLAPLRCRLPRAR